MSYLMSGKGFCKYMYMSIVSSLYYWNSHIACKTGSKCLESFDVREIVCTEKSIILDLSMYVSLKCECRQELGFPASFALPFMLPARTASKQVTLNWQARIVPQRMCGVATITKVCPSMLPHACNLRNLPFVQPVRGIHFDPRNIVWNEVRPATVNESVSSRASIIAP